MKALVTGASGFIGSTLIEELDLLGFDVYALLRESSSTKNLEGLRYHRVDGSLSDVDSLKNAVQGMDYVFHLAGVTAASNRDQFFENNAEGTKRLAEAVVSTGTKLTRFVYLSSLAAGGPCEDKNPRKEEDEGRPVSAYGESKLRGEEYLLQLKSTVPITIIRPPIVYGPKDKAFFVVIQTVAKNMMPMIKGGTADGHKYYSAIHVKDLCRGIVQSAVATPENVPSGEVFYLSGDGIYSYQDILLTVAEKLNRDPLRITIPPILVRVAASALSFVGVMVRKTFPLNSDKVNELLPDYWICSNEKAKRILGFSPEFDLSTGMGQAIEWYKKQKWI